MAQNHLSTMKMYLCDLQNLKLQQGWDSEKMKSTWIHWEISRGWSIGGIIYLNFGENLQIEGNNSEN